MNLIKLIILFIILFMVYTVIVSRPFKNDYKCIILCGKKGSGKSTLETKLAVKFNDCGWHVFSDSPIFNTYKLDVNWCGRYDYPENSVLIIDEGALTFFNRDWKSFSNELKEFFILQRHKKVYVIIAIQDFNALEKVLRSLSDEIYLCVNYFNIYVVAKKIHKGTKLANQDNDSGGMIAESYSWDLPLSWMFCFVPRWFKFFNSFRSDKLPEVPRYKYKFENEPYLHKLKDWKYYKYDQLKDLYIHICKFIKSKLYRVKFFVSDNILFDLLEI